MSQVQKMKKHKEKVLELLQDYEDYRDDDLRLIAAFYFKNYGNHATFENMSGLEFLINFSKGVYVSPDQITRIRRKLQEEFPELRGKKYEDRHKAEAETREEIKEL